MPLQAVYRPGKIKDFRVIAAVSAVAEHSIAHEYAAGRPDGEDRDELRRFVLYASGQA